MKVPWLSKKSIAAAAAGVIADYEAKINRRVEPPIPVENIIERGLGLRLGFADVSKQAMIIRLQGLGLVRNETWVWLSWAASYCIA